MAVAITAEIYGTTGNPPPVLLTLTGLLDDPVIQYSVYRQAPGEPAMVVRGAVDATPEAASAVLVDIAPPMNRVVTYYIEYFTGASLVAVQLSADPVTVPFTPDGIAHHVITDAITGDSMLVTVMLDEDERVNAARATQLEPAGAVNPIVLYDVRRGDAATLNLFTRSRAETLELVDLLAPGRPIISRHDHDDCDIASVEYLVPLDTSRKRRTRNGDRFWTIPVVTVDLPDPTLVTALVSLADLAAYYDGMELLDIAGDFASLLDIARAPFGVL